MIRSIVKITLIFSFFVASQAVRAQEEFVAIDWGTNTPLAPNSWFTLGNSNDVLFNTTDNTALVAMGYFADGFNVADNAGDLATLFANFSLLDSAGMLGAPFGEGTVNASENVYTDTGIGIDAVGSTLYYWVLPGVATYSEASVLAVAEYALMTDSGWGVVPTGAGPPDGEPYNIQGNTIDTVLWGTLVPDGGVGAGSSKILTGAAVPEPSTYAGLFGVAMLLVVHLRRRRQA